MGARPLALSQSITQSKLSQRFSWAPQQLPSLFAAWAYEKLKNTPLVSGLGAAS